MTDTRGQVLPRRFGVLLALVPVLAVGLADAVIAVRTTSATPRAAVHAPAARARPTDTDAVRASALRALLYGVAPLDPVVMAAVAALLLTVALVANYIPARRATRIDPVEALYHE